MTESIQNDAKSERSMEEKAEEPKIVEVMMFTGINEFIKVLILWNEITIVHVDLGIKC